jgi:hypothetical protein
VRGVLLIIDIEGTFQIVLSALELFLFLNSSFAFNFHTESLLKGREGNCIMSNPIFRKVLFQALNPTGTMVFMPKNGSCQANLVLDDADLVCVISGPPKETDLAQILKKEDLDALENRYWGIDPLNDPVIALISEEVAQDKLDSMRKESSQKSA